METSSFSLTKHVTGICNRMSREHFETLSRELLETPITNVSMFEQFIYLIVEKSLRFTHFHDLFADLLYRIQSQSLVWIQTMIQTKHEKGQWYVFVHSSETMDKDNSSIPWDGPFSTREDVIVHVSKTTSLKRIVLEHLQSMFHRLSFQMNEFRTLSLSETTDMNQLRYEQYKQKWLSVISLISHLYSLGTMIHRTHISYCIQSLISPEPMEHNSIPTNDSIMALCKLLLLVGFKYDHETKHDSTIPWSMVKCLDQVKKWSVMKQELDSRTRFRCLDVLDASQTKWTLPDMHVDKQSKTEGMLKQLR